MRHTWRAAGSEAYPIPALILCILLLAFQHLPASAQEYVFRPYRQSQGLDNLSVNTLTMDRQGFLWAGTQHGVYRFLGSNFQRFGVEQGILEQTIRQIFVAPDNTLWVATDGNLYRWNGREFHPAAAAHIIADHSFGLASGGPGVLLVVSSHKLSRLRYDPAADTLSSDPEPAFPPALLAAHISLKQLGSVVALPDDTLWMACGRMLCSWQAGVFTEWSEQQGVPPEFYRSILKDHDGNLWAVGQKFIIELEHGSSRFVDRALPVAATNGSYARLPIACDPQGRILVSQADSIARWNGTAWQTIGRLNGLTSTHLTAFLFDERGNLWMGSTGHGLHHWLGYANLQAWTDREGLPSSNVWSIGPFEGDKVWVGTEKGPATIDTLTGQVALPFPAQDWTYGLITGMVALPGSPTTTQAGYLLSTASGALIKIDGRPARPTLVADLKHYIYSIFQDSSNRSFAITGSGAVEVSATGPPVPLTQISTLLGPKAWVTRGCRSPGGTVWFGSENGIVRLTHDSGDDRWSRPPLEGLPSPLPRLSNMTCAPDESLWLTAGDATVWRVVYQAGTLTATRLILPEAMQSSSIVALFLDSRGWLWIATDDGLLVWNHAAWQQITQEDGLIWNDLNAGKMIEGPDGAIWADTSGGLSRILHPEQLFAIAPPRLSILDANIGAQRILLDRKLDLPWSRRDLTFQFASPDAINRAGLIFHYRMAGLQQDWIASREETARFQTLPPGDYDFQIYAQDRNSGARSTTLTLQLHVRPPWWRSPWFYTLCAIALVLAIAAVFHLRIKHLRSQQHQLENMVLERTLELELSREQLRFQATHDSLTGLLNRGAVLEALDQELTRARQNRTPLTIVLADIDHFKKINDSHGHLAGDDALRNFSAALNTNIRSYDHAGRYGGEEFLIVLVAVDSDVVLKRLSDLHKDISGLPITNPEGNFVLTCSLGVVQLDFSGGDDETTDQDTVLAIADQALYAAKRAGRNRFLFGNLHPQPLALAPTANEIPA